jgi:hypothetical protein
VNKEQASEAYIKGKLRDHQEYLGCGERRRMKLIQSDMYKVQKAFENGWDEAKKKLLDKSCAWLEQHQESYDMYDAWRGDYVNFKSLIIDFRKAMEE